MGATGWSYFVPYQEDMQQVLDGLRRDVFTQGAYERPIVELSVLDEIFELREEYWEEEIDKYGLRPYADVHGVEGLYPFFERLDEAETVATLEDLDAMRQLSSSGTGSILDITEISSAREFGCLYPLPEEVSQGLFATDRPSRSQLQAVLKQYYGLKEAARSWQDPLMERDEGVYVVLYEDGQPQEIYIEGYSGD